MVMESEKKLNEKDNVIPLDDESVISDEDLYFDVEYKGDKYAFWFIILSIIISTILFGNWVPTVGTGSNIFLYLSLMLLISSYIVFTYKIKYRTRGVKVSTELFDSHGDDMVDVLIDNGLYYDNLEVKYEERVDRSGFIPAIVKYLTLQFIFLREKNSYAQYKTYFVIPVKNLNKAIRLLREEYYDYRREIGRTSAKFEYVAKNFYGNVFSYKTIIIFFGSLYILTLVLSSL